MIIGMHVLDENNVYIHRYTRYNNYKIELMSSCSNEFLQIIYTYIAPGMHGM